MLLPPQAEMLRSKIIRAIEPRKSNTVTSSGSRCDDHQQTLSGIETERVETC